jgi:CBS domain-containing protein
MEDVFVGSLMSMPVETVTADTPLRTAGETMLEHDIGSVVVVGDDDRIEGILTATDFVRLVAEGDVDPGGTVGAVMSTDLTTITADATIQRVADLILERGFHHVPVVDGDEVIGIITTRDLSAYLSDRGDVIGS